MTARARLSLQSLYFEYEGPDMGAALDALKTLQGNLFLTDNQAHHAEMEKIPIARHDDPDSSKAAAERITESGLRGEQHRQVLAAVRQFPGKTSRELAVAAKLDRYMVGRRLPEIEKMSLIRRGDERRCSEGRGNAVTWWPSTVSTVATASKKI